MKLSREAFHERPALDTAVSAALLQRVVDGDEPETLRIYRPRPLVLFGPRDRRREGFAEAIRAAEEAGYPAVERLGGGLPAVFDDDTIAFAWAMQADDGREGIRRRFLEIAEIIAEALESLGVEARVGEVPGEYCAGEYSVNARGKKKIMGVGQRIVAGGVHLGGVLVVDGHDRIRDVLIPVYRALNLDWDTTTVGSVAEEVPGVTFEDVDRAIVEAFARRGPVEEAPLTPGTVEMASRFEPRHALTEA